MTQPDYKFYKKKILKFLVSHYTISKNKFYRNSPITPKYKIINKDTNEQIPVKFLLEDIKKIFVVDCEIGLKKYLNIGQKIKSRKKIG
jgi:hypothetical protein